MIITVIAILIAVLIIIVVTNIGNNSSGNNKKPHTYEPWVIEAPEKRAGRRGEHIATEIIKGVLREGDYLFTNISVSYDGKRTELDNVVVNKYGVFIFEVKNYKDHYNWEKYKDDGYGNTFVKEVKNPVKQVKRQIYILAKYLEGYNVWVEGYVILIRSNSPVQSTYILQSVEDIDRAIHTFKRNHLSRDTVESIKRMLV